MKPLLVIALAACATVPRASARAPGLASERGELVLRTRDGRELRSASLVGATLQLGASSLRLDAVKLDPTSADRLVLHHFLVVAAAGPPSEMCTPDPRGERWALAVASQHGQVELVCSSGAIGKCIRWGYPPWRRSTAGRSGRALHEACVRMVRADYGGDGATATRDGTWIAFCDLAGVHPCRGDHDLEAAWSPGGAACVAHPRIPDVMTLAELARRYPRLANHVGPSCTLASAAADDRVILFSWAP